MGSAPEDEQTEQWASLPERLEMRLEKRKAAPFDLLALALDGFDRIFVPRKLVRMVELFHQISAVANARGKPLVWSGGAVDVRVVLVITLIQLFQPELYRMMRRRQATLPSLLAAFAKNGQHKLDSADVADVDLKQWALYNNESLVKINEPSLRMTAEQVRLPLVEQIREFRSTQRHGFNVLKLVQALANSLDASNSSPEKLIADEYFSLLSEPVISATTLIVEPAISQTTASSVAITISPALGDTRPSFTPRNLTALLRSLVSPDQAVQANLASEHELQKGHVFDTSSATELLKEVHKWLEGQTDDVKAKQILRSGLQIIAPFIHHSDGKGFWELVKDDPAKDNFGKVFSNIESLHATERWADLRSTLGQDDRFDSQFFYLPNKEREEFKADQIPGFVHVPASQDFAIFKGKAISHLASFHIARYLTTVDQYACFIQAKGYEDKQYWDSVGWDWLTGAWDQTIENESYKKRVSSRIVDDRLRPIHWQNQLAHGSRPVWGVSWFEARAYCRWLGIQLKDKHSAVISAGLPTEAQWERAARASSSQALDSREYAWNDTTADIFLRANIAESKIGHPSAVGLFESSPIGLSDLSGNLWEWQSNFFTADGAAQNSGKSESLAKLKTPAIGMNGKKATTLRCAVARGATRQSTRALRFASGINQATGATMLGFVWCCP
ncbi:MAG: formylglycine-generating enzyme family protein [Brachymonas sp.]|nr:formylglycine-generating enzyme family protein [Brachymonas sp.]